MPCPVWHSQNVTLESGGGAVVERQGLLVRVSRPRCAVSCDRFMRRRIALRRDCLCPTPSVPTCPCPDLVHDRRSSRFTVLSGSGVGFSLASCAEGPVRAGTSQSPTKTTENRVAALQGRVDARKVLPDKVVTGPRPVMTRMLTGVDVHQYRFLGASSANAGSGCTEELLPRRSWLVAIPDSAPTRRQVPSSVGKAAQGMM